MSAIQDLIKWFHNKHIFCITDEGQDIMDKVYELAKDEPLMYTQAEVDKIKHDAYNNGWHDTVNGVCIYVDEKQLLQYIKDNECTGDFIFAYFGMTHHISHQVIKQVGDKVDLLNVAMDKAIWEANFIEKRMKDKKD
jgi:hypothetical protein